MSMSMAFSRSMASSFQGQVHANRKQWELYMHCSALILWTFSSCINTIFKIAITWIDFEAMAMCNLLILFQMVYKVYYMQHINNLVL